MAREFAKVNTGIWQDDDFRELPPHAQHLYIVLLTDPELSYCGITDWRPRRILPKAKTWELNGLMDAARILTEQHLIIVDEDTEEVLIRSFLRHDGVMEHNKLCISAMNAFSKASSNTIRGVIVHELLRLEKDYPTWPAWGRDQVREVLKRRSLDPALATPLAPGLAPNLATDLAPQPAANPSFDQPVPYNSTSNDTFTTATKELSPRSKPRRQLPDDWTPTTKHQDDARERNLDLNQESQAFRNHAQSVDRLAVNWNAAFANWLLKAKPKTGPDGMAPSTQRAMSVVEIGRQMQARADQTPEGGTRELR